MESKALILLFMKFAPESDKISGRKVIAAVIAKINPKSIRNAKALFLKEASGSELAFPSTSATSAQPSTS